MTRGPPYPQTRASWTASPARLTAQPHPLPLTVGRDARREPEHETPPARGAGDHLQGPVRRRTPASRPAARRSPDLSLTAALASRPQIRSSCQLADGSEAHGGLVLTSAHVTTVPASEPELTSYWPREVEARGDWSELLIATVRPAPAISDLGSTFPDLAGWLAGCRAGRDKEGTKDVPHLEFLSSTKVLALSAKCLDRTICCLPAVPPSSACGKTFL